MKQKYGILLSLLALVLPLNAQEQKANLAEGEVATFDDLYLEPESYWNGSDESGGFISGPAYFFNSYNPNWLSWGGWSYSNISDNITPGWGNQYSAITGAGRSSESGSNYGISYASPSAGIVFKDGSAHEVSGFYVTNTTYTTMSIKHGDDFSKKFGGEGGADQDWLKLTVIGYIQGDSASSATFYLADYRGDNPEDDYIVENWEWFDLAGLGKVDSLAFSMSSTDNGDWGMNTPSYFAMDNLTVVPDIAPIVSDPLEDVADEAGKQLDIDINGVFTDEDDDDLNIAVTLKSNTDDGVATASLDGMELSVSLLAAGSTTLTFEAISNNKSVEESMMVSVTTTGRQMNRIDFFRVYPNPTNGLIRIASMDASILEVSLYDPSGRRLDHYPMYLPGASMDISEYPPGTYILKAQSGLSVARMAILKQ